MSEKPISFTDGMMRKVLAGEKTQSRRVIAFKDGFKPVKSHWMGGENWQFTDEDGNCQFVRCRYGEPGVKLWVREGTKRAGAGSCWFSCDDSIVIGTDELTGERMPALWPNHKRSFRPPMHMKRDWCRVRLRFVDIRVEQVQDISTDDVVAEGVDLTKPVLSIQFGVDVEARSCFTDLWQSINAGRPGCSWDENPYVFVIQWKDLEET